MLSLSKDHFFDRRALGGFEQLAEAALGVGGGEGFHGASPAGGFDQKSKVAKFSDPPFSSSAARF